MSTESLYGMCLSLDLLLMLSARVDMTRPRVVNDLFMLQPSLRRKPSAPVLATFSLPAKSTRLNLLSFSPDNYDLFEIEREKKRNKILISLSHFSFSIIVINDAAFNFLFLFFLEFFNENYCMSHFVCFFFFSFLSKNN